MARPVWTGSISFGLVNVPVKAFTAVRDHEVHFHQIERTTGARIHNQKISEKTGEPVDPGDIELGYEIRKGRYVTFERSELDELRPTSTNAIEVSDFVALGEIDPIYYQRTYWLAPDGAVGKEPYGLLIAAMEARKRVGVGTVVMRNKQYLAAVRPLDGVLAMSTMRFADEVVPQSDIDDLPSRRSKPDAKAVRLAGQIVESLTSEWDPQRYRDTFTDELKSRIERKDAGEEAIVEEAPAQTAKVLDLMAALEASVNAAKAARPGRRSDALAKAAAAIAEEAEQAADFDEADGRSANPPKKRAKKATAQKAGASKTRAKKAAGKSASKRPTSSRKSA